MPSKLSQMRSEARSARRAAAAAAALQQPRSDPSVRGHSQDQQRALLASLVKPMKRAGKPAEPKPPPPPAAE